jgi:NAD(P)-dependent dehydrogenase (short-subunit alcohol dehydrogenase family)
MVSVCWLVVITVPPGLALTYAVSAALFNAMWFETTWKETRLLPILTRLVLVIAAAAVASTKTPVAGLVLVTLLSSVLSLYFLRYTRRMVVEGGPPPAIVVQKQQQQQQQQQPENNTTTTPLNDDFSTPSRIVVITGANTGIGKETARVLARQPRTVVVLCCRDIRKAEQARKEIFVDGGADIRIVSLDLSRLESVRMAAAEILEQFDTIDIVINNAGLMHRQHQMTADGCELTLQVNHLGHYLFTRLLLPSLSKSKDARILNLTSSMYVLATNNKNSNEIFPFDDMFCQTRRSYSLFGQYAVSKLANVYFTASLAARYSSIFTAAIHPGLVRTDVVRNMPWYLKLPNQLFGWIIQTLQKTPSQGAWCTLHLATCSKDDHESLYWVNRKPHVLQNISATVLQKEAARLWEESARLVGLPVDAAS